MNVRIFSGSDMLNLIKPVELVNTMEDCFKKFSMKKTLTPSRVVMTIHDNWWGVMPSYVPEYGVGVKIVSVIPSNRDKKLPTIPGIAVYFDDETGVPKAVMDGAVLTGLRTAAASALSVRYMKPSNSGSLAIIGAGYQARFHVKFIENEFNIDHVKIYDIYKPAAQKLKEYVSNMGYDCSVEGSIKNILMNSDIIVETSTTSNPVVIYRYLKDAVHIVSIGAHTRSSRALDDETIKDSNLIVVDSKEAVYQEAGDIYQPIEKEIINWNKIIELGEFLMGIDRYKSLVKGVTIYKSVGIAIEDVCAASLLTQVAEKKKVGYLVEL